MTCVRAEELLSDHLEGSLPGPLRGSLDAHLAGCPECAALRETLAEVVAALRAHPVIEPPADLSARAAARAWARRRAAPRLAWRFALVPPAYQAAAALVALLVTGGVLLASSGSAARLAARAQQRGVNAGVFLLERKDRLVEDLRLLRVYVRTAFGSRVESVGERVEDYRRLLEQRRQREQEPRKTRSADPDDVAAVYAAQLPEPCRQRPRTL
jgi:hypothetical protein